jgi:diguanylate cyclase (GGDEF)-like protein
VQPNQTLLQQMAFGRHPRKNFSFFVMAPPAASTFKTYVWNATKARNHARAYETMNPRPFTVLILSANRQRLRRLTKFLEVFGYEVRQAADARQALAAAEVASPDFLIVESADLPQGDLQICRQIRRLSTIGYVYSLLLVPALEVVALTEALEAGFDDFLSSPVVFGELLARLRAGARGIEFERRLADQNGLDATTGLMDKAAWKGHLQERLAQQPDGSCWLAMLDIDYFSRIPAISGRGSAASLLRSVAEVLKAQTDEADLLGCLGQDQFCLITTAETEEAARESAVTLLTAISEHAFELNGEGIRLTASCGLTALASGEEADAALVRADRCLQLAKASGRNCVCTPKEVDDELRQWTALAGDGKLFETTVARDVMIPCALLFEADETIDQALALIELTKLSAVPVIDHDGKLAGLVTGQTVAAARSRSGTPRGGSSVRLVRHAMTTEVARFEETTPLGSLLEFFTGESAPLAVITHDKRPLGIVNCQGLAALNERLNVGHFSAVNARTCSSQDLLVPDLALAD